jgi:hypothetical protein
LILRFERWARDHLKEGFSLQIAAKALATSALCNGVALGRMATIRIFEHAWLLWKGHGIKQSSFSQPADEVGLSRNEDRTEAEALVLMDLTGMTKVIPSYRAVVEQVCRRSHFLNLNLTNSVTCSIVDKRDFRKESARHAGHYLDVAARDHRSCMSKA